MQPGEEKALKRSYQSIEICDSEVGAGIKKIEPNSSHWYPATEKNEAMGIK